MDIDTYKLYSSWGFINQQKLGETLTGGEMRKWMIESARIWILSVQIHRFDVLNRRNLPHLDDIDLGPPFISYL